MSNTNSKRLGGALLEMAEVAGCGINPIANTRGLVSHALVGVARPNDAGAGDDANEGDKPAPRTRYSSRDDIERRLRAAERAAREAPDDETELRLRREADVIKADLETFSRGYEAALKEAAGTTGARQELDGIKSDLDAFVAGQRRR